MKRITRIDEMIAALCEFKNCYRPDGYSVSVEATSHAKIRAIVPQFIEEEPETREETLTRVFGPLPEQRIPPLSAIAALREYFQEAMVCGVHHRITGALNYLERSVEIHEGKVEQEPEDGE